MIRCDRCGADDLQRIKRPARIKIFYFWIPLRKYRCAVCKARFYGFELAFFKKSFIVTAIIK